MEKRKIDRAELDMEVQHDHSWGFPFYTSSDKGCTTSGKSSDCCWHDCTVYTDATASVFDDCTRYWSWQWSAFS